jgi:hypothetical protein
LCASDAHAIVHQLIPELHKDTTVWLYLEVRGKMRLDHALPEWLFVDVQQVYTLHVALRATS